MPARRRPDRPSTSRSAGGRPRRTRGGRCPRACAARSSSRSGAYAAASADRLGHDLIEEVAPGAILDLDDPGVGIETELAHQAFFDLGLGSRLLGQAPREQAVGGTRVVEYALRRRAEQLRGPIKTVELDENRAGLFGPAPPHGCKCPFDLAAADIGRNPDRRFEAHSPSRS